MRIHKILDINSIFRGIVGPALLILAGLLLLPSSSASAASAGNFFPGYIIDDHIFYDGGAMSAGQIQDFLDAKGPTCDTDGSQPASDWGRPDISHATLASYIRAGSHGYSKDTGFHAPPYTCIKNYKQNTPQMEAASGFCGGLSAKSNRTAAQIIKDIAAACGINPQVLIVLLQKEQSLITDTWPLNRQYQKATGFDCPDSAPCDPAFAGFFYQVYYAAKQFKIYKAEDDDPVHNGQTTGYDYNYRAGQTNRIYYNPDLSRCGSSNVYLHNQATAGLYIYTPYRPNKAALSNLYGTGDSCSAYGNRNFWRMFTDWFGNPLYVGGKIGARWKAIGGPNKFGIPDARESCTMNSDVKSCSQDFPKGTIYYSSTDGAWESVGKIGLRYKAATGSIGYPTNAESCAKVSGVRICHQDFTKASIYYSSATGAWEVKGKIGARWKETGGPSSPLGMPTAAESCAVVDDTRTCHQDFSKATIYYTAATGAWETKGKIGQRWATTGGTSSSLGMPTTAESCATVNGARTCHQDFARASIYYTAATGAWEVKGKIGARWVTTGAATSSLGMPEAAESCSVVDGTRTCLQDFTKGTIYYTAATGAWESVGKIGLRYKAAPSIGYPTAAESCATIKGVRTCHQTFTRGTIYYTAATGAWESVGKIGARYATTDGPEGYMGVPKEAESCSTIGGTRTCRQNFTRVSIYYTAATGAWEVMGKIGAKWKSLGGPTSLLGMPISPERVNSLGYKYQKYEEGRIYYTASKGAWVVTD